MQFRSHFVSYPFHVHQRENNNSALALKSVYRLWVRPPHWLKNGALLLLQWFSPHVTTTHIESGQHVLSCSQMPSLRPVDGSIVMKVGITIHLPKAALGSVLPPGMSGPYCRLCDICVT